jgi:hypothetical protein
MVEEDRKREENERMRRIVRVPKKPSRATSLDGGIEYFADKHAGHEYTTGISRAGEHT